MRSIRTHAHMGIIGDTGCFLIPTIYADVYQSIRTINGPPRTEAHTIRLTLLWLRWNVDCQIDMIRRPTL